MALASVVVLGSLDVREECPDVAAAHEHPLSAEGFDDARGRKPATEQVLLEAKLEFDPVPLRVPAVAAKDIALAESILDQEVVVATARRQGLDDVPFPQPKLGES
jgi:hypothetical protein